MADLQTAALDGDLGPVRPRRGGAVWLGVLAIAASLLCNKWFLERVLAADEEIGSASIIIAIALCQAIAFAFGVWLLWRGRQRSLPGFLFAPAAAALLKHFMRQDQRRRESNSGSSLICDSRIRRR